MSPAGRMRQALAEPRRLDTRTCPMKRPRSRQPSKGVKKPKRKLPVAAKPALGGAVGEQPEDRFEEPARRRRRPAVPVEQPAAPPVAADEAERCSMADEMAPPGSELH